MNFLLKKKKIVFLGEKNNLMENQILSNHLNKNFNYKELYFLCDIESVWNFIRLLNKKESIFVINCSNEKLMEPFFETEKKMNLFIVCNFLLTKDFLGYSLSSPFQLIEYNPNFPSSPFYYRNKDESNIILVSSNHSDITSLLAIIFSIKKDRFNIRNILYHISHILFKVKVSMKIKFEFNFHSLENFNL